MQRYEGEPGQELPLPMDCQLEAARQLLLAPVVVDLGGHRGGEVEVMNKLGLECERGHVGSALSHSSP